MTSGKTARGDAAFRALVENSPDIIGRFDRECRHLYLNPAGMSLFGLCAGQVQGKTIRETAIPEPFCSLWEDRVQQVFASGQPLELTCVFAGPTGLRDFELRCVPEIATGDRVQSVLVIARDVTERRQAAAALRESQERYQALFVQAADAIVVFDPQTLVPLDFNNEACRHLGYTRAEFATLTIADFEVVETAADTRRHCQDVARTGGLVFETRQRTKDGCVRDVEVRSKPIQLAGKVVIQAVWRDITARKQAERALAENEAHLRLSARAANVGFWSWDLLTESVYYSPEWKQQIGYRDDEIGNSFAEWQSRVHPDDLEPTLGKIRAFLAVLHSRYEAEFRFRHKDGNYLWIYTVADVLCDGNGAPVRMLGCHIDITARKRMEEQLQGLNEKLELKVKERTVRLQALAAELTQAESRERRRIADVLHDDLQQHLVGVQYKVAALQPHVTAECGAHDIEWLVDELARIVELTRNLATRLRPPALYEFGLRAALNWLVTDMRNRFGLTVTVTGEKAFRLEHDDMRAFAFDGVTELLMNVVKHAAVKTAQIRIRWTEANLITLEVVDQGVGFDVGRPGQEPRFGLFSIRERVAALGGRFDIASGFGKGTCAALSLPARHDDAG